MFILSLFCTQEDVKVPPISSFFRYLIQSMSVHPRFESLNMLPLDKDEASDLPPGSRMVSAALNTTSGTLAVLLDALRTSRFDPGSQRLALANAIAPVQVVLFSNTDAPKS